MESKITSRIVAESGMPRLFPVLAEELSPSDLQSLLLAVHKARVRSIREPEILARAGRNALFGPSDVDARVLNGFDRMAFAAAEGFEAVDPVSYTHLTLPTNREV